MKRTWEWEPRNPPLLLYTGHRGQYKGICDPVINYQERYRAHLDIRVTTLSAAKLKSSLGNSINMFAGTEDRGRWSVCFLMKAVPRMFQFSFPV